MEELNLIEQKINESLQPHGFFTEKFLIEKIKLNQKEIQELIDNKIIIKHIHNCYYLANSYYDIQTYISLKIPEGVYSLENASFLHDLTNQFVFKNFIIIPNSIDIQKILKRFNRQTLLDSKINIKIQPFDVYQLGITRITNPFNFPVKVTNKQKTICDLIWYKNEIDREIFTDTIYNYFFETKNKKDLQELKLFANKMNIVKEVEFCKNNWNNPYKITEYFYGTKN